MYEENIIHKVANKLVSLIPDKMFLSLKYRIKKGKTLDWENPQTFSEKMQWLKLYNRKSNYTNMVDKYAVKKYVANIIGDEYIIPTIHVWDNAEEIDFNQLPEQFVLKATHDSGRVIICKDKSKLDWSQAIKEMSKSLKRNFYSVTREWPYKNVPRRIIAEKFMSSDKKTEASDLRDYKFFCFSGKVHFFKIDFGRFIEHHANYYSPDGCLLDFGESDFAPVPDAKLKLPENLNEMILLAEKLAGDEPFIRVDFYNIDGKIYFGELTFFPNSGFGKWTTYDADINIGKLITLPVKIQNK